MGRDSTIKDEGAAVEWLEPATVKLYRDPGGSIRATVAGRCSVLRPTLVRAFPITTPALFVELREDGGGPVGMLRRVADLDEASRALADDLLKERYLIPFIDEIRGVRSKFGNWIWDVLTDRGEREFTIKSPRDDIRPLPGTGDDGRRVRRIRITDVDGNVYEIRDYAALSPASKALFERIA
jgi:hypothetical protein